MGNDLRAGASWWRDRTSAERRRPHRIRFASGIGRPARTLLAVVAVIATVSGAPVLADTLLLDTGERLSGRVMSEEGGVVVFESEALGKLSVRRERIARVEKAVAKDEAPAPAPVLRADNEPAEADRTASELPSDQPPVPAVAVEAPKEDLLRLWVDQGLRYQIVQPVRIQLPFGGEEELLREDVRVTGRIGIRAAVDGAGFETGRNQASIPSDVVLRTLRFYTTGDWNPTTSYALQLGVIDNTPYLHQANVRWRDVPWVGNLSFGYLTVQQTLENVLPFGGTTFMEPALPVLAFAPGNRMGLQVDRAFLDQRMAATFGLYSVGADPGLNFGDQTQSLVRPTLRVTGLPVDVAGAPSGRRLLHLGASASLTIADDSDVRYRARPESFIAPFLVDTGTIDARRAQFVGAELVWLDGPFTLQAEAIYNRVGAPTGDLAFGGAYVSGSWMLTGEEVAYNRAVGVPDRVIPARELSLDANTWGAWQIAARASWLDLSDGAVRGGRMAIGTLGVNWWWNRYLRWQMDYSYGITSDTPGAGRLQILQGRVQLMY